MTTKLSWSLLALSLSACGTRTDAAGGISPQPPQHAAAEQPTGDTALTNHFVTPGKRLPEIYASEWVNTQNAPSLRELDGRPVLVSFCRLRDTPCEEGREVLRDLSARYGKWGFTVIELFVDQPNGRMSSSDHWRHMRSAVASMNLPYAAGFGERIAYTEVRYGFDDVPAAYLVDAEGRLVWSGNPKKQETSLRAAAETIAGRGPT